MYIWRLNWFSPSNCVQVADAGLVQDDDDELRLVRDLFEHYDINVRPTVEKDLPIVVKFGIAYTQIVDLVIWFVLFASFK